MNSTLGLISLSLLCGIGGQLTLKIGMTQVGRIGLGSLSQPVQLGLRVVQNPLVLVGLGFYALGATAWLVILSRVPLSYAYPILALSFAVTPFVAWLVLGETIPPVRWLGIMTIWLGVFIVSRG